MSRRDKRGFTLVEVLIYIAILAIVLGFALLSVFKLGDSTTMNRSRMAVNTESDFALQKIAWALAGAEEVEEPAVGATSSRLLVRKFGFPDNPITLEIADGALSMKRGSGPAVPITTHNVKVDSLTFSHGAEVQAAPGFIEVVMLMSASSSFVFAERASTTIRTTIYLRQ